MLGEIKPGSLPTCGTTNLNWYAESGDALNPGIMPRFVPMFTYDTPEQPILTIIVKVAV